MTTTSVQQTATDGTRVLLGVGGLISLVLGLFVLFSPKTTAGVALVLIAALIGVYAVVTGLVYLGVTIFSKQLGGWSRVGHGLLGVLYVVGGVFILGNLMTSGVVVAIFLSITLGVLWLFEGILAFVLLGKSDHKGWSVFYGIISVIAGITLIFSPLMGAATLWWLLGIAMAVLGLMQVIRAFRTKA